MVAYGSGGVSVFSVAMFPCMSVLVYRCIDAICSRGVSFFWCIGIKMYLLLSVLVYRCMHVMQCVVLVVFSMAVS